MNKNDNHNGVAVIGGGAAGFFCAIQLASMCPSLHITIFEQQQRVLKKVEISGGGRCNCTNTFADVTDFLQVYPRGGRLMKHLFKQFGPEDTLRWFESHGVPLTVEADGCVFPKAQDSHAVIDCFLREAGRLGINVVVGRKIENPMSMLSSYDFVVVTTGGLLHSGKYSDSFVDTIIPPLPSLFTFNIDDEALHALKGIVTEHAICNIPCTTFRAQGPLLLTHWGMSGPAILKLSSYAARYLAEYNYCAPLTINWTGDKNTDNVRKHIIYIMSENGSKLIENVRPFALNARLWTYLINKLHFIGIRCNQLGSKRINQLTELLTCDRYTLSGRSHYKQEFVTCGGVSLKDVNPHTLESRHTPRLYYAGEVLDIDGITGGFNFQAAWTTAYAVACAIQKKTIPL